MKSDNLTNTALQIACLYNGEAILATSRALSTTHASIRADYLREAEQSAEKVLTAIKAAREQADVEETEAENRPRNSHVAEPFRALLNDLTNIHSRRT